MKNFLIVVLVIVAVVAGSFYVLSRSPEQPIGAAPGPDFYETVNFLKGSMTSGNVATSSQGSVTVTAAEFKQWADAGVVSFAPGLVAGATLTFPASSTLQSLVPKAGDRKEFCIRNATSTAAVYVTLAGGTGTNLLVASSSVSALGSTKLVTGKVGCITLIRQPATANTFDIDALLTVYQ